ncbi:MAG: biotin--[acetyl-CoA-carboxylase] ligase [Paludibacter sp.]|nr:MAG: biotin--[acetyl-CoA-carboxylase] ligase [Paludibacter sp.]
MKNFLYISDSTSTNDYLKSLSKEKELPNGFVVYTDFQFKGKGQMGNRWQSERGQNLLFSCYIKPNHLLVKDYFVITEIVTIAIKKILDQYTDNISIKWSNDIYWKNKKIGGILIENSLCQEKVISTIIGIGLNINQVTFDENLPNPISLFNITNKKYNRIELLKSIVEEITTLFTTFDRETLHQNYLKSLFRINEQYLFYDPKKAQTFSATIKTVDNSGDD